MLRRKADYPEQQRGRRPGNAIDADPHGPIVLDQM